MEEIQKWIFEDIITEIKKISFSIEAAPLAYLHAITSPKSKVIICNPDTVSLFELSEEKVHAEYNHHRRFKEYDVLNLDEQESHQLSFHYLLNRWQWYEGCQDWLKFVMATGTPSYFKDEIITAFT
ncbi:hypothetical protein [Weissella bombi]|uniref:hypothetical protein n=1 Tax=Weissella bombi TaxID=1505725 RepID=UPI003AF1F09F